MPSRGNEETEGPVLYLLTVLWGKTFREMFLSVCLPSLLAPENIPIIENKIESRLVIVTTEEDWQAMQDHSIFKLLRSYIEPVHIAMQNPKPTDLKMLVMSAGQKAATEYAFSHGAFGMVLCPDIIYSDGTVATLQHHARVGVDVVFAIGMRFEQEGVLEELEQAHLVLPGRPLRISPRDLVALALEHLHSESKLYEWDSDHYWRTPVTTIWAVPGSRGFVAHSFSWTPLLVDYAAIKQHATDVFDHWTMDANYIYDNFGKDANVHVVQDSDELMQVSLTSEKVLTYYPLAKHRMQTWPVVGRVVKSVQLMSFVRSEFTDPLRRKIFVQPVRIHADPINGQWKQVEARAQAIVARAIAEPSRAGSAVQAFLSTALTISHELGWHYRYRRFVWQRVKEKIGLARSRARWDDGNDWVTPAFGLLNPIWSLRIMLLRVFGAKKSSRASTAVQHTDTDPR